MQTSTHDKILEMGLEIMANRHNVQPFFLAIYHIFNQYNVRRPTDADRVTIFLVPHIFINKNLFLSIF